MGYEEAQASLASLTADLERAKEELASRKKRERMLSQRVEDLLEEIQAEKEKRVRDQESYAKEIKRCRKETYRAELAVVEARQDLQDTRAELKKSQAEVQHEKTEKEKARQESFERAYALAGMVGEVEQAKDHLKVVQKERDAAMQEAKNSAVVVEPSMVEQGVQTESETLPAKEQKVDTMTGLQEDKGTDQASVRAVREAIKNQWAHHSHSKSDTRPGSAHSTASGAHIITQRPARIPPPRVPDFSSIVSRLNHFGQQLEEEKTAPDEEIEFLKQELVWAKRKHAEDADLIHLMHMQCQFKACPCRLAESNGDRFVHDQEYDAKVQQQRASKKRKIAKEHAEEIPAQLSRVHDNSSRAPSKPKHVATKEAQIAKLPPDPTPAPMDAASEEPLVLEQAIEVPLPEPDPMELDSSNSTPEATAQLEEITQVLVEPTTGSKAFTFSTSVTGNADVANAAPILRHVESASAAMETDLFDLSPPKQPLPRRPSTAMGILGVESPIRLVPESPRSVRASRESGRLTKERNHTITKSTTTKVALKESSPKTSLHRRAQSKPNLRSHSPLVTSAVMSHNDDPDASSILTKETSASPAASTVFPMTPVHKHSRSLHHRIPQIPVEQQQAETHLRSSPQTIATTTTTTRVPLRDTADADDVFSPEHARGQYHVHEHAQTEVLNVRIDSNTTAPAPHSQTRPISVSSSSAILANVPGTPISREAALAQIRARRDRARSVNLKRSLEGGHGNGKESGSGRSPTKTRPAVVNGLGKENVRNVREISQASAPGRFA